MGEVAQRAENYEPKWKKIASELRDELGENVFRSWFRAMELDRVSDTLRPNAPAEVRLSVPTPFLRYWIRSHYLEDLREKWESHLDRPVVVEVYLRRHGIVIEGSRADLSEAPQSDQAGAVPRNGRARKSLTPPDKQGTWFDKISIRLNAQHSLDNFVEGTSNAQALASIRNLTTTDFKSPLFKTFFVHASVGLGKTHLLQAVALEALACDMKVIYLSGDRFVSTFVEAMNAKATHAFKRCLRDVDMLVIDDLQFLRGDYAQNEFGHLMRDLLGSDHLVLASAHKPIGALKDLDERIRSRFSSGLLAELGPMDRNLRYRVLQRRLEMQQAVAPDFTIPLAVIEFLADEPRLRTGRDLEGCIVRLFAHHHMMRQPITVETARSAIHQLIEPSENKRVMIDDIQRVVTQYFNITRTDLISSRRTRSIVRPRQIAMYLSKTMTARSLPEIGRRFGDRDHTTVLHAVRKIELERVRDDKMSNDLETLQQKINE